jgi:hypothetical protein
VFYTILFIVTIFIGNTWWGEMTVEMQGFLWVRRSHIMFTVVLVISNVSILYR